MDLVIDYEIERVKKKEKNYTAKTGYWVKYGTEYNKQVWKWGKRGGLQKFDSYCRLFSCINRLFTGKNR